MNDVCLNLLTKVNVASGGQALEDIWSLDNWRDSLGRVKSIECTESTETHQKMSIVFDADREIYDVVGVERFKSERSISVSHVTPPPGIKSLTAIWWYDEEDQNVVYAKRKIIFDRKRTLRINRSLCTRSSKRT